MSAEASGTVRNLLVACVRILVFAVVGTLGSLSIFYAVGDSFGRFAAGVVFFIVLFVAYPPLGVCSR